jgi:acyl-CoA dehydrogenase
VLKRYEDDGKPSGDRLIVAHAAENGLYRFQEALAGAIDNFPVGWARVLMRAVVFPLGRPYKPASDRLGSAIVRMVLQPGEVRDRLTRDIFVSHDVDDPTGLLEVTLAKVVAAEDAERKLDKAIRAGTVRRYHGIDWFADAQAKGVLTESEAQLLREVEMLVERVIAVDHFDPRALKPNYQRLGHNSRGVDSIAAE